MGAEISSTKRRCGLCLFELPEGSGSMKRQIERRYEWFEDPEASYRTTQSVEANVPFDAPLKHTKVKELRAKCFEIFLGTDWDGLQESISRGCAGCKAMAELLLAAAKDDDVELDEKSGLTFLWRPRAWVSRVSHAGRYDSAGILKVVIKARFASPRQSPFGHVPKLRDRISKKDGRLADVSDDEAETEEPLSKNWTFWIDIDRVNDGEKGKHSHPFEYETPATFGDTGSEISLQRIEGWLKECMSTHELCGGVQTKLPDRVLELTTTSNDDVLGVRLVETAGIEEAPYVCLSHRWGPSTPSCRTLKGNLADQKKMIEWNKLLKTFRDASLVTVRLGIKYIWIDSLCIVQDDADDWRVQAAKMCDIYHGGYVTLAASCSDDSEQGMFRKSKCCRTVKPRQKGPSCVVSRIPEHPTWDQVGLIQLQPEIPLLSRSWVYQERLLSPRIIHFTRYELVFECSHESEGPSYCECHNMPGGSWGGAAGGHGSGSGSDSTNLRKKIHAEALRLSTAPSPGGGSGGGDSLVAARRYWHQIVEEYSGYHISTTSDKLPALAGIARQYGTAAPQLGRYVAGMWENTLIHDLMWFSQQLARLPRAVHHGRPPHIGPPEPGSLPTWSWISAGQYVNTSSSCPRVRPEDLSLGAGGFDFTLSGPDEYGAIRDASLELEGFVAAGKLVKSYFKGLSADAPQFQGAQGDPQFIHADYAFFEPSPDMLEADGEEIFCMRTGFAWGGKYLLLVLRPVREQGTNVFERIGMIRDAPRDWMDATFSEISSKTTIKII